MMNWHEFQKHCAALCAWREARGEGRDGMRMVIHVIANRASSRHQSWAQVVYAKLQFSSMTYPHDPQLTKIPVEPDPEFVTAYELADSIWNGNDFDLTQGATHYFADTIEMPEWAKKMTFIVKLGHHSFFKE